MINFTHIKINIGLNIVSKRDTKYHNIETILFPVNHYDILEIIPSSKFELINKGIQINCKTEDNLCYKAFQLIKEKYEIPDIKVIIYKNIPFGTGLGAGSSNATHTLLMLNEMFKLGITKNEFINYSSSLGADCSFFLHEKPCYAEGIGNELSEVELNLKGKFLVLCFSDISIDTKSAYQKIKPKPSIINVKQAIKQDISTWRDNIFNDFEHTEFPYHKLLENIKNELYDKGAVFAQMTGSGSCIYGIFEENPIDLKLNYCNNFRIISL